MITSDQLNSCVSFLMRVEEERLGREDALRELRQLRETMPAARLDLCWTREASADRANYTLLASSGNYTCSLGIAEHGKLPWQLRGSVEPQSHVLLTVDGTSVTIGQAIGLLDFIRGFKSIANELVDLALLTKEQYQIGESASEAEVDTALDQLRLERGLEDDTAYEAWLASRHMTTGQFRSWIAGVLVHRALQARMVGPLLNQELAADAGRYRRARVAALELRENEVGRARELIAKDIDILVVADMLNAGEAGRNVIVRDFSFYEAPDVFAAGAGQKLVTRIDGVPFAIKVLRIECEVPPAAVENRAIKRLINAHLRDRRARANIRWHWGTVDADGTTLLRKIS
jgi:putative peptide maturation system protein